MRQDDSCDIEELLKKQEDFEKMIEAQEERFAALTRLTKVSWLLTCTLLTDLYVKDLDIHRHMRRGGRGHYAPPPPPPQKKIVNVNIWAKIWRNSGKIQV